MKKLRQLNLAQKPTPLYRLKRMSEILGIDLWIKRDDLTGDILTGGNKIRKLEFILAHAADMNADTALVAGGVQSNLVRTAAALAVSLGMRPVMVLGGEKPGSSKGNYFLISLLNAEARYIKISHPSELEDAMENIAEELRNKGSRPYIVNFGASNGLGTMGYVDAFRELALQKSDAEADFDHIFVSAGSGGTLAGIVAGMQIERVASRVTGISPWLTTEEVKERTERCISELEILLDVEPGSLNGIREVTIDDSFIGEGYGIPTGECISAIRMMAEHEAVILDHTYTGKAMAGLIKYVETGKVNPGRKVLFWHTGGASALFALEGALRDT